MHRFRTMAFGCAEARFATLYWARVQLIGSGPGRRGNRLMAKRTLTSSLDRLARMSAQATARIGAPRSQVLEWIVSAP